MGVGKLMFITGLADVMGAPGIDGRETKSNHILEMQNVLGTVLFCGIPSIYCIMSYRFTQELRQRVL